MTRGDVMSYEGIRERLFAVLENEKVVRDQEVTLPWCGDVVIGFRLSLSEDNSASAVVTDSLLRVWRKEPQELLEEVKQRILPQCAGLGEYLGFAGVPAMVLTTQTMVRGAVAVLLDEPLKKMTERFGSDLVLLPSSIHEWIVMPYTPETNISDMADMVRTINATVVDPQDRLSDQVFWYSSFERSVALA